MLFIQSLSNTLKGVARCTHLENAAHDGCIGLIYYHVFSTYCVHGVVPIATPTCIEPAQEFSFETTVGFLRQFFNVKGIHHAVHGEE